MPLPGRADPAPESAGEAWTLTLGVQPDRLRSGGSEAWQNRLGDKIGPSVPWRDAPGEGGGGVNTEGSSYSASSRPEAEAVPPMVGAISVAPDCRVLRASPDAKRH